MRNLDQKERKVVKRRKTVKGERGREREGGKSATYACLGGGETGPKSGEIPESGANTAYRHRNISNVTGAMDRGNITCGVGVWGV